MSPNDLGFAAGRAARNDGVFARCPFASPPRSASWLEQENGDWADWHRGWRDGARK